MQEGRELLAAGLEYLADESSEGARVALLHSPGAAGADGAGLGLGSPWVRGVLAAVRLPSRRPKIPGFLRALLEQYPGTLTCMIRTSLGVRDGVAKGVRRAGSQARLGPGGPISLLPAGAAGAAL